MAVLTHPHWQTVTPEMINLLHFLGQQPFLRHFYLAGGTALALQLGHRRSVDLDFFSDSNEVNTLSRLEILRAFEPLGIQVIENVGGNLLLVARGICVGFFSYGYPLIGETLLAEDVRLASLHDIGLMKCDALITRGSRKDFYDLYFLARQMPFEQILAGAEQKYASYRDYPLAVLESMVAFDNADRDVQPLLLEAVLWQTVRDFFIHEAGRLGRIWLQG